MSCVEPARKVQFLLKCMDFKEMHGFLPTVAKKVPLVGPGMLLSKWMYALTGALEGWSAAGDARFDGWSVLFMAAWTEAKQTPT